MEQEYAALDLRQLLLILRRNVLALVLCLALGAEAGFAVARHLLQPQYQASALLLVSTGVEQDILTTDQINSAKQLVGTYAVLLTNDTLLEHVIQAYQMDDTVESLKKRITAGAVDQTQVMRLAVRDKDAGLALAVLETLVERAPAALDALVKTGSVQVVSPPRLEEEPVSPNVLVAALLGGAAGLVLCLVGLFMLHLTRHTFITSDDVNRQLDLPVLGTIPMVKRRGKRGALAFCQHPAPPLYREGFGTLRTNLTYRLEESGLCRVVVASPGKGEGKSSVAVNLAASLAAAGSRVLLIDCNLRSPQLHTALDLEFTGGLTDVLDGIAELEDCVCPVPALGIWALPAGTAVSNPAELLGSAAMAELVARLAGSYEYLLFDTPAITTVTDAAVLSRLADGVLLVVRQRATAFEQATQAQKGLDAVGARVLGAVLNDYDAALAGAKSGTARQLDEHRAR